MLLKRTMGLDALDCPKCGDRMQLIAAIENPDVAARILRHLNLPTRPPPRAPPWRAQRDLPLVERRDDAFDGIDPPAFVE